MEYKDTRQEKSQTNIEPTKQPQTNIEPQTKQPQTNIEPTKQPQTKNKS